MSEEQGQHTSNEKEREKDRGEETREARPEQSAPYTSQPRPRP